MDGDDRLRPVGDLRGRVLDVEVERRGIDVGEDGSRAALDDRLGRRVERERRANDLVAGADAHCVERDDKRLRAVRDADRALHAEVRGGLLLERPVVLAADELARLEHSLEGGFELGDQRPVLGAYVNERDRLHDAPL